MLSTTIPEFAVPDGHAGYVAGSYRDGAHSYVWTDVRRCAPLTFTAYVPACTCGWTGDTHPGTDTAWHHCRRAWLRDHIHAIALDTPLAAAHATPA